MYSPLFIFFIWVLMAGAVVCMGPVSSWGGEKNVSSSPQDSSMVREPAAAMTDEKVARRARQRSYPGGADEEDLQVQDPLPVPQSRFNAQGVYKQVHRELFENKKSSRDSNSSPEE